MYRHVNTLSDLIGTPDPNPGDYVSWRLQQSSASLVFFQTE